MTARVISDFEIVQRADELLIRGRRKAVIASVIATCLLVPFGMAIAYRNVVGTADVPAIWNRSGGDRVGVLLIVLIVVYRLEQATVWRRSSVRFFNCR